MLSGLVIALFILNWKKKARGAPNVTLITWLDKDTQAWMASATGSMKMHVSVPGADWTCTWAGSVINMKSLLFRSVWISPNNCRSVFTACTVLGLNVAWIPDNWSTSCLRSLNELLTLGWIRNQEKKWKQSRPHNESHTPIFKLFHIFLIS